MGKKEVCYIKKDGNYQIYVSEIYKKMFMIRL